MATPRDELLRNAARKHYEKRKAEGKTKLQAWLDPQGAEALEFLLDRSPGMSKTDIVNRALRYLAIKAKLSEKELEEALKGTAEFKV